MIINMYIYMYAVCTCGESHISVCINSKVVNVYSMFALCLHVYM